MNKNFNSLRLFISSNKGNLVFSLFLLIYSSYLIFLSYKLGLSYDEPFSLTTTANKLSKVISLSYDFEGQPPVYFILLSLWRKINGGIFFARLLSLIFTYFSAFFLYKVTRLLFAKTHTKWIIVLFLLNPFTVWASLEIRVYSLIILLTIVAFYFFYLIYFYQKNKLKVFFVLVALLGVYTQYYFVFLIISFAVLLLFRKGWRPFFNYVLLSCLVALLFLPNLLSLKEHYELHQNSFVEFSFYDRINSAFSSSLEFFVTYTSLRAERLGYWILRIAFIVLYILTFRKFYNKCKSEKYQDLKSLVNIAFLTLFLLATFIIIYSQTSLILEIRYLSIIFPFHIMLLLVFGIYEKKVKHIFYCSYAAFFLIIVVKNYHPPYLKAHDFKSISSYVQKNQTGNEPILFHGKHIIIGFSQYYKNDNPLISLPEIQFNHNFYSDNLRDTSELNQLINNIDTDSESFLIITGDINEYFFKKELTNKMIDTYLNNNYTISKDTTFEGNYEQTFMRLRRITKR